MASKSPCDPWRESAQLTVSTVELLLLCAMAFLSSVWTSVIGVGGGPLLISVMPGIVPAAAIIPVHGLVSLVGNLSRISFSVRDVVRSIFWPFLAGALIGALVGTQIVIQFPADLLPLSIGIFILVTTWLPTPTFQAITARGTVLKYWFLGAVQTFLSLFVGAVGPLASPFLIRDNLSRDEFVVTNASFAATFHTLKALVFAFAGFSVTAFAVEIGCMIVAVILGSYVGMKLRGTVSEAVFKRLLKILLTILSLRMIFSYSLAV